MSSSSSPIAPAQFRPLGARLPRIRVAPPGPASRALAERLRRVESRNVTFVGPGFPVFWEEARGANVLDADGNLYLDWTGAFGVAFAGHRHPRIDEALEEQSSRLVHGMGDVHPPSLKVDLLERLAELSPWADGARGVLATAGSEAVEIALKTAHLYTGRAGVVAFRGGYHGLTSGALAATARPYFRRPFLDRLHAGVAFLPFPATGAGRPDPEAVLEELRRLLDDGTPSGHPVGALLVEPVQGRGGVREFPDGFLAAAAGLARERGAVVIADEVFTGLGRTGEVWASPSRGLEPDLLCAGKALGGGLPLSVCLGRPDVMEAWPASPGEALHTSTFLGHPLACATALAFLDLLEEEDLPGRARESGARILGDLRAALADVPGVVDVRGAGLLIGIELECAEGEGEGEDAAVRAARVALGHGLLVLPAGDSGEVVEATPSSLQTAEQVEEGVRLLALSVREALEEPERKVDP